MSADTANTADLFASADAPVIDSLRSWMQVPDSGVVFRRDGHGALILFEWYPLGIQRVRINAREVGYPRCASAWNWLPRRTAQRELFRTIMDRWEPRIYALDSPLCSGEGTLRCAGEF